ncbi:Gmad2 immunoglobulin-like domain-containing protein [Kribbella sp. NPDC000426]|uniref:Gmad2 immunoglobulin-like domain-containing protein n=1 Tax=Kribbella sp. NPDC000426 TaxID=3154255 RepID=UPI00333490D7
MNDQKPNEPFDELMRRALRDEADRIEPADALPEIRARAHAQRQPAARRPWLLTAGVAALGTAAAVGAFTVFNGSDDVANDGDSVAGPGTTTSASSLPQGQTPSVTKSAPSPVPATLPPSTSPAVKTTTQPTDRGKPEQSVTSAVVPVYWLGQQVGVPKKSAAKLYRTWAKVSGHPAEEAVRIMTTKQPNDPDYYSVWRGAAVNSVTRSDGVVTVDFKQLPRTTLAPDLANVATQQLIYTVQGALSDDSSAVQITQQGRAGQKLFGQVDTSAPLGRAQAADVQALVWITSPTEGAVTGSKVTVEGTASAFEATVNYQLTNLKTRETKKSFTNTKEGQKFSPFAFSVSLTPGPWQIEAYLISDADGTITNTDSKTIEVK